MAKVKPTETSIEMLGHPHQVPPDGEHHVSFAASAKSPVMSSKVSLRYDEEAQV